VQKLGGDACKTQIECDSTVALCKYKTLDTDGDGHPPIVCGGDDCNDSDAAVVPGHAEICDSKDNDCNGQIDDGCKCPSGLTLCGKICVNTSTDPKNCGGCNTQCSACQNGTCLKCPVPDLFIEQDLSASMDTSVPAGITRWDAARSGINAFMLDPLSTGLGLGIGYFPVGKPCMISSDCGFLGTGMCINGRCDTTDSCSASDYAIPAVPLALLPGVSTAIANSTSARAPDGSTPQAPALQGALTYAKSYATANPGHRVAVVLISDGLANECTTPDVPTDSANIAAAFLNGTPQVKTFVIAIGNDVSSVNWNTIATAGGTGSAYVTASSAEVQSALNSIRSTVKACP
jgi:hypothetical protein